MPRFRRLWRSWWPTLALIAGVLSFRSAVADWYDVPTGSMQPTIYVGDRILVDKTAYDWRLPLLGAVSHRADPARGDIVTFASPADGVRLVKRVIALPGDMVEMRGNRLLLNGEPLAYADRDAPLIWSLPPDDPAPVDLLTEDLAGVRHTVMLTPDRPSRSDWGPVRVPEGRYLMLGDNRDNSADSRWFGFVPREAVEGRAHHVAVSLDHDHGWLPRWGRTLAALE
ncbi:signal peptidase I [bacterium]|nr:signal peptidase I [bacterium]HPF35523.1 signal peptidase I [Candidatus Krumholzibacteria bacterium]HRX51967.1 signal peptidase I [Candidatus Krumholzibacteria bacterium]